MINHVQVTLLEGVSGGGKPGSPGGGGGREGNTESFIVSLDVNKPTLP